MDDQPIKIDSNWVRIDVESIEIGEPQSDGTRPLQVRCSKARYKLQEDGSVRDIQTNDVFPAEVWKGAISQMIGAVANGPTVKSPERRDLYEMGAAACSGPGAAVFPRETSRALGGNRLRP